MKSQIVLVLMVGRDIRLLRPWLSHYSSFHFDRRLISVHARPQWPPQVKEAKTMASEFGAEIVDVHTSLLSDQRVRRERMIENCCSPVDWIFTADVDEFHQYPRSPRGLVELCERQGYDFVSGRLLDRVAPNGSFPELDERSLWEQFPVGVQLTENILKGTVTKTVCSRASVPVVDGTHSAEGRGCPKEYLEIPVHHFKWDAGVFERAQYMVWMRSISEEPWFVSPLRFLRHAQATGKLNLQDPQLNAFWPRYNRLSRASGESGGIDSGDRPFDLLFATPTRRDTVTVGSGNGFTVLFDEQRQIAFRTAPVAARVWSLIDGMTNTRAIVDALVPPFENCFVTQEMTIQRLVLEMAHLGLIEFSDSSNWNATTRPGNE